MTAVDHGPQIVALLNGVCLAEETRLDGSVGRYAVHHTRSLGHQLAVMIE